MKKILFLILTLSLLLPLQARAIDPGIANGTLTIGKEVIVLKNAYAHLHDNAEGGLESKEMRILLTDRQVPQESLAGLNAFFSLAEMLRQDKLRGVLLRFDPAATGSIVITNLIPPKDPMESIGNKSLSYGDRSPIDNLRITEQRVQGAFKLHSDANLDMGWPLEDYALTFSAPLFREPPVTADLSGDKALKSPQVVVLLAKCAAAAKGDMKKARQFASDRSNQELDSYLSQAGEQGLSMMQQMAGEVEKSVRTGKLRLIERGSTATLIVDAADGKNMIGFVKAGNSWKTD